MNTMTKRDYEKLAEDMAHPCTCFHRADKTLVCTCGRPQEIEKLTNVMVSASLEGALGMRGRATKADPLGSFCPECQADFGNPCAAVGGRLLPKDTCHSIRWTECLNRLPLWLEEV